MILVESDPGLTRQPRNFWRLGKYLVPLAAPGWPDFISPPTKLASLETLAALYPEQVRLFQTRPSPTSTPHNFSVIRDGEITNVASNPFCDPVLKRVHIEQGTSVGRECILIGPDGTLIEETAFHTKPQELQATLKGGKLNPNYWKHRYQGDLRFRRWLPPKTHVTGTLAAINNRSCHNFYHWMLEIAPRIAALHAADVRPDFYLLDHQLKFQQEVLRRLDVSVDQCIQPHCNLQVTAETLVHVTHPNRDAIARMAETIGQHLYTESQASATRIYISRRDAKNRKVANEDQVIACLRKYDFRVVTMSGLSIADQMRLAHGAEMIVAPHGAGLTNILFCRPKTQVIELFPESRRNVELYPSLSMALDLVHTTLLCPESRGSKGMARNNLLVDPSDLELAIEVALNDASSSSRRAA